MTSIELLETVTQLRRVLSSGTLVDVLDEISSYFRQCYDAFIEVNGPTTDAGVKQVRVLISGFVNASRRGRTKQIFREIDEVRDFIQRIDWFNFQLLTVEADDDGSLNTYPNYQLFVDSQSILAALLTRFEQHFEAFIEEQSQVNTLKVLLAGHELNVCITSGRTLLSDIEYHLSFTTFIPDDNEELSLQLNPVNTVDVVSEKLVSLAQMYEELCRVLNVSSKQYPLRIIKLETGSLWVKLFGERQVVKFLTDSIKAGAQFLYRNKTREGQLIHGVTAQASALEVMVDLKGKLQQAGIDTAEMDESIRKAGVILFQNTLKLLGGEPDIKVNDEWYSPYSPVQKLLYDGNHPQLHSDVDGPPRLLSNGEKNGETEE